MASTNDYFKKTGASTVTTLSAPGKALGATSITVGSTTNYPSDTGIIIAIRVVDTNGELVAGTYTEWSATVSSGTSLAIVATPVYGSDQVYAAGSTTQVFIPVSSYAHSKLIDGLLVDHKQDGTHSDINADTITTTGNADLNTLTTDTITGKTDADSGTVFGVPITNSKMVPANISNPYKFRVTRTTNQTGIADATSATVAFNSESYDTNNNFDTSTYKYTIPVTGYYQFDSFIRVDGSGITLVNLFIMGDGGQLSKAYTPTAGTASGPAQLHDQLYLTAGDKIYVQIYVDVSSGTATIIGSPSELWFSGHLLSI